jgi:hypothetical protein
VVAPPDHLAQKAQLTVAWFRPLRESVVIAAVVRLEVRAVNHQQVVAQPFKCKATQHAGQADPAPHNSSEQRFEQAATREKMVSEKPILQGVY